RMKVVIAPDSFKGSLPAQEVASAIAAGIRAVWPEATIDCIPLADGGEGTVQALVSATGGRLVETRVTGPLGEPVDAFFGVLGDGAAPGAARPPRSGDHHDARHGRIDPRRPG